VKNATTTAEDFKVFDDKSNPCTKPALNGFLSCVGICVKDSGLPGPKNEKAQVLQDY